MVRRSRVRCHKSSSESEWSRHSSPGSTRQTRATLRIHIAVPYPQAITVPACKG